jgi:hypothetical protein
MRSPTQN